MSQIAQLSEADIEDRFHINGKMPIQFMLAGFAREREPFALRFGNGDEQFLTTLLGVDPDKGRLIFDCSGSLETNRRFLLSERNIFAGRPAGIQVQFTCGPAVEVNYDGSKAFAVTLPRSVLRLQRRESFRIETPRVKPLMFNARLPKGGLLSVPVHDLSVAGVGLLGSELPDELVLDVKFDNARFSLPDDAQHLFVSARVRHLTERESRAGMRQWRIGLVFDALPAKDEHRLQRYIVRVEHERHELS